ncbi:MAG: hypothetical protein M1814_000078 [Vezdaea aestivalis]|nr:MAG: hypothetical protein M1814_000078 [Vezdaea aestivalis]
MRTSTLAVALFGGLSMATPILRERLNVVEVEVVTIVTTITAGVPAAVATPPPVSAVVPKPTPSAEPIPSPKQQGEFFAKPSSAPAAVSTAAASVGGGPPSTSYKDVALWHHNIHRANHSSPAMSWSDDLAASAMAVAQTCVYQHNTNLMGGGYGQNIAAGAPPADIGNIITDMMYNSEIGLYPGYGAEPDMSNFHQWGHFSQIIWAASTQVGCATYKCGVLANSGSGVDPYFTVCNYKTPGNFGGRYAQNVLAPKGQPTIKATTKAT